MGKYTFMPGYTTTLSELVGEYNEGKTISIYE